MASIEIFRRKSYFCVDYAIGDFLHLNNYIDIIDQCEHRHTIPFKSVEFEKRILFTLMPVTSIQSH